MGRLIDANALVEILDEEYRNDKSISKLLLISFAKQILSDAPTVEAKPVKHGHWIEVTSDDVLWRCSVCKELQCCYGRYCSTCGARMDEVTE